ncbi:MAG TPA: hypothetical protein VLD58_12345, partial [Gemmatimonadales bacterium]|nr:hypothetical protein [Gemmatimonadales bacterium]
MGLKQTVVLAIDELALSKLGEDFRLAGRRGVAGLQQEFAVKMADLRADLAKGLINEKDWRAQAQRVGTAFNNEIVAKMDGLKERIERLGPALKDA